METWHFVILLVVVNSAIWSYFDASRQRDAYQIGVGPGGRPPHTWASWIFLFWPAGLPLYLRDRSAAQLAEPRSGPPPRFKAGGFTFFAVGVGLLGLAVFAALIVYGRFRLASIGLVITAAGLFGGRSAEVSREAESVELGELGLEQIGFRPGISEDEGDDAEIANVEAYFANLAAPRRNAPAPPASPGAAQSAAPPPVAQPTAPPPAAQPPAPPPVGQPSPPAPALQPSAPPPSDAAKAPPPPSAPTASSEEPPPGVPYSPPPAGVVYTPPSPGAAASPPAAPPSAPRQEAPPPPPRAPGASPSPPPPPSADNTRATVALSPPAAASEIRARAAAPAEKASPGAPGPSRPPSPSPPAPSRRAPATAGRPPSPAPGKTSPARAPRPTAASAPRPVPRPSAPRPPAPRPAGYGYATAKGARRTPVWIWAVLAGLGVLALAAGAYTTFWPSIPDEPVAIETMPAESEILEEEDPGPPPDLEEVIEEGVEDTQQMEIWLEDYDVIMGKLALTLDEIDFDGIESSRCRTLRLNLGEASTKLGPSPDPEVDLLISRAIASFNEALKACRAGDENAWALALLTGKESTHEAQRMMDRRYLYRGVLELELESATGAERSPESISGRFLASSLP